MTVDKVMKSTTLTAYLMAGLGLLFYIATQFVTALFPVLFGIFLVVAAQMMSRPSKENQAVMLAAICSFVAVMLGISSAMLGSWTTFTSLVEQITMAVIAAAHLKVCVGYLSNQADVATSSQNPEAIY